MAAKMLSRSAEILNDADDFTRQLDWQLFVSEMEAQAATYEGDWYPGKPMYRRPASMWFAGDQWIRPMIEEFDIDHYRSTPSALASIVSDCEDCQVLWNTYDPCWVCGKEVPQPKPSSMNPYEGLFVRPEMNINRIVPQLDGSIAIEEGSLIINGTVADWIRTEILDLYIENMTMVQYAAYDAATSFRMFHDIWVRMNQDHVFGFLDELSDWNPFLIREPEPVTDCGERFGDNYYDPRGEFVSNIIGRGRTIQIPNDLDLSGRIPITPPMMQELPNPVPQHLRYREENYITNERRRRNL